MRLPTPTEEDVHRAVVLYLRAALPDDALLWHTPNTQLISRAKNFYGYLAKLHAMGFLPGFPDLCVLYRGRLIAIELKRPKRGRTSDTQDDCQRRITLAGGVVSVCRSVNEVDGFLRQLIPDMKARLAA